MTEESPAERRAYRRVPTTATATIAGPMGTWTARVLDIGLGGALLDPRLLTPTTPNAGARAPHEGAMTSVEIELGTDRVFHAFARIRWSRAPSLMGVEFLDLDPAMRRVLSEFVDQVIATMETGALPAAQSGPMRPRR